MKSIRVFIASAEADRLLLKEFRKHLSLLEQSYPISFWDESDMLPGSQISKTIIKSIENSNAFLLFMSVDFLHSRFFQNTELRVIFIEAINRSEKVFSILARHCPYQYSAVSKFQILPEDKVPLTDNSVVSKDKAFNSVLQELELHLVSETVYEEPKVEIQKPEPAEPEPVRNVFLSIFDIAEELMVKGECKKAILQYQKAILLHDGSVHPSLEYILEQVELCKTKMKYAELKTKGIEAMKKNKNREALSCFLQAKEINNTPSVQRLIAEVNQKRSIGINQRIKVFFSEKKLKQKIGKLLLLVFVLSVIVLIINSSYVTNYYNLKKNDINIENHQTERIVKQQPESLVTNVLKKSEFYRSQGELIDYETYKGHIQYLSAFLKKNNENLTSKEKNKILNAVNSLNNIYILDLNSYIEHLNKRNKYQKVLDTICHLSFPIISKDDAHKLRQQKEKAINVFIEHLSASVQVYLNSQKYIKNKHDYYTAKIAYAMRTKCIPGQAKQNLNVYKTEMLDLLIDTKILAANKLTKYNQPQKALNVLDEVLTGYKLNKSQKYKIKKKRKDIESYNSIMKRFD